MTVLSEFSIAELEEEINSRRISELEQKLKELREIFVEVGKIALNSDLDIELNLTSAIKLIYRSSDNTWFLG